MGIAIAVAVVAVAAAFGVSLFAFTDAGEKISAPITEVKQTVGLAALVAAGILAWAAWKK